MKIRDVLILLGMVSFCVISSNLQIKTNNVNYALAEVKAQEPVPIEIIHEKMNIPTFTNEKIVEEVFQNDVEKLSNYTDAKEWFIAYKDLIAKWSWKYDAPEMIYDVYSQSEIDLMARVIEAEVGDLGDFYERVNVANVILNRISEEKFHCNTLSDVLTPSQFSTIRNGAYKRRVPTENTMLAIEFAYTCEDTTYGSLYFESKSSHIHYTYADYVMEDSCHKFYK